MALRSCDFGGVKGREMEISNIIFQAERIIFYVRIQNYTESNLIISSMLEAIKESEILSKIIIQKESRLHLILLQLTSALEFKDMILFADILSEALIPELKAIIKPEEAEEYNNYRVEPTSSGFPTIYSYSSKLYLHSNTDPMEEARILAEHNYKPSYDKYVVWGCGLGYHVLQLYEISKGAIDITVYDSNSEVFDIAMQKGLLRNIPKERLHLIEDRKGEKFVNAIANGEKGILMHFPSILSIQNEDLRNALHGFFPQWNTIIQIERDLEINFRCNQKNATRCVDDLKCRFQNKEVILIAGGPSLDECIDWVRSASGNKIVIAVARVLGKLIDLEIIPDYAVTLESNKVGYEQIKGLCFQDVPLILDSTAYWENAANYKGEKYIAYQRGYKPAEEYACHNGRELYDTGGSVITLALDILLKSNVKQIYLIGADLAYPDGITHASNTLRRQILETENMITTKSVNGDIVPTTISFNKFRRWIEQELEKYPFIDVYNLSKKGAYIEGTKKYNIEQL